MTRFVVLTPAFDTSDAELTAENVEDLRAKPYVSRFDMTPPTAWAHLPNAECIDHILAHLAKHPERWAITGDAVWGAAVGAARDAVWGAAVGAARGAAVGAVEDAVKDAAWDAVRDAARDAAWDAARGAVREAAWGAAVGAARGTAWGAILALAAYDDCAYMLNLPLGALNVLRSIDDPQAVLLYPAVVAMRAEP